VNAFFSNCQFRKATIPPHAHWFYANINELGDPYFQKVGTYVPPDLSVALPVEAGACSEQGRSQKTFWEGIIM